MSVDVIGAIVIDSGSGVTKAGFAGHRHPLSVFPTLVGFPKKRGCGTGRIVGDEAQVKRDILHLIYPITRGIVSNWDEMEKLWNHAFKSLNSDPEEYRLLITEAPFNPPKNREKMTEIMFETFRAPALYIAKQANLSLYATGTDTGVVVDSGHDVTYVTPIIEGNTVPHAILRLDIAGGVLSNYLGRLLHERQTIRDIKERLAYVSLDFDSEMESGSSEGTLNVTSQPADEDNNVTVGNSLFRCPEPLFKPDLVDVKTSGIHKLIHSAVEQCDSAMQEELYANIILSGGSTMFPGFVERLKIETTAATTIPLNIKITAPPERHYLTWKGGSQMASLPSFNDICISREEYDESGPLIMYVFIFGLQFS